MDNEIIIEQIRVAREITVALIDKALIPFAEEDLLEPERLAAKIGCIYATIYIAVKNPSAHLNKK
jgi:hypothetical protein